MIRKLFFRLSGLVCLIIMTVAANAESIPIWSRWDHSLTASDAASPESEFAVKLIVGELDLTQAQGLTHQSGPYGQVGPTFDSKAEIDSKVHGSLLVEIL